MNRVVSILLIVVAVFLREVTAAAYDNIAAKIPGIVEAEKFDTPASTASQTERTTINQVFRNDTNLTIVNYVSSSADNGFMVNFVDGEWATYTLNVETAGTYDVLPHGCRSISSADRAGILMSFSSVADPLYFEPVYTYSCTSASISPTYDASLAQQITFSSTGTITLNISMNASSSSYGIKLGHIFVLKQRAAFKTHTFPVIFGKDYDDGVTAFVTGVSNGYYPEANSTYRSPMSLAGYVTETSQREVVKIETSSTVHFTVSGWPAGFYHPAIHWVSDTHTSSGRFSGSFAVNGVKDSITTMYSYSVPRVAGANQGFTIPEGTSTFEFSLICTTGTMMYLDYITFEYQPLTHTVPGNAIQAEAFGYPASDYTNTTSTSLSSLFRNDSYIGISQQTSNSEGLYKIRLLAEESVKYNLDVKTEGLYDIVVVACRRYSSTYDMYLSLDLGFGLVYNMYGTPYFSSCTSYARLDGIQDVPRVYLTTNITSMNLTVMNPTGSTTSQQWYIDSILILKAPPAAVKTHAVPGNPVEAEAFDSGFSFRRQQSLHPYRGNKTTGGPYFMDTMETPSETVLFLRDEDQLNYTLSSVTAGLYSLELYATVPSSTTAMILTVGGEHTFNSATVSTTTGYYTALQNTDFFQLVPAMTNPLATLRVSSSGGGVYLDKWRVKAFTPTTTIPGVFQLEDFRINGSYSLQSSTPSTVYRDDTMLSIYSRTNGIYGMFTYRDNATYDVTVTESGTYLVILGGCSQSSAASYNTEFDFVFSNGEKVSFIPPYHSSCSSSPRPFQSSYMPEEKMVSQLVTLTTAVNSMTLNVGDLFQVSQQVYLDYLLIDKAGKRGTYNLPGVVELANYDFSTKQVVSSSYGRRSGNATRVSQIHPIDTNPNGTDLVLLYPGSGIFITTNVTQSAIYNLTLNFWLQTYTTSSIILTITVDDAKIGTVTESMVHGWNHLPLFPSGTTLRANSSRPDTVIGITASTSSRAVHVESLQVDLITPLSDDGTANVRFPIHTAVPFANYSATSGEASVANEGNYSTYRLGSEVDISTCWQSVGDNNRGCSSGVAVTKFDVGESLTFKLSNPGPAMIFNLSVSMQSTYRTSSSSASTYFKVYIVGRTKSEMRIDHRGALASQTVSQELFGLWNYTYGPIYIPSGDFEIMFQADGSATSYSDQLFFDQFILLPTAVPFGGKVTQLPFIAEAERFDRRIDYNPPVANGTGSDGLKFRDDEMFRIDRIGDELFVDIPKGSGGYIMQTVYVQAGTYQPTMVCLVKREPGIYQAQVFAELNRAPQYIDGWSSTPSMSAMAFYYSWGTNDDLNATVSTRVASTLVVKETGYYTLTFRQGTRTSYAAVAIDKLILKKVSGTFNTEPLSVPGVIKLYQADYGGFFSYATSSGSYDTTADNTGNRDVRFDKLDTSFIGTWNDIAVVDIDAKEHLQFTINVHEAGRYNVFFSGELGEAIGTTPGQFYMRMNFTAKWGWFQVEPGVHTKKSIGTIDVSQAGETTFYVRMEGDNFVSFYSLEFVSETTTPTHTSFLPNSLLTSGLISPNTYDYGGLDISFSMHSSYMEISKFTGRSGDTLPFVASNGGVRFGKNEVHWIVYTFKFATNTAAGLASRMYGSPNNAYLNFHLSEKVSGTIVFDRNETSVSSSTPQLTKLGTFTFSANTEYILNVSYVQPARYVYSTTWLGMNFDTSVMQPLPAACYTSQSLADSGCSSVKTSQTDCTALATDSVMFGDLNVVQPNIIKYCDTAPGERVTFSVPSSSPKYKGVALMLTERFYVEEKAVGSEFQAGSSWDNGILSVQFNRDSIAITDVKANQVVHRVTRYSNVDVYVLQSTGLEARRNADGSETTRIGNIFSASSLTKIRLSNCFLRYDTTTRQDQHPFGSSIDYCKFSTLNDPRSKFDVIYSSGRAVRVATAITDSDSLGGFTESIAPIGQTTPMSPVSNCGPTTMGASDSTVMPVLAIPFASFPNERVVALRYTSHDTEKVVAVAGLAWIKDEDNCAVPTINSIPVVSTTTYGLQLATSTSTTKTGTYARDCAVACSSDPSCEVWEFEYGKPSSCRLAQSTEFVPAQLGDWNDLQRPPKSIGIKTPTTFQVPVPFAAFQDESSIRKPSTYPSSQGWSAIFLAGAGQSTLAVNSLTGLAIGGSASGFRNSRDFISVVYSGGYMKQCGAGYDNFDDKDAGISGCVKEHKVASCGRASFTGQSTTKTESVYVMWSAKSVENENCPPYAVAYIQGTLLPAREPVFGRVTRFSSVSPTPTRTTHYNRITSLPFGTSTSSSGVYFHEFAADDIPAITTSADTFACQFSSTVGYTITQSIRGLTSSCDKTYPTIAAAADACGRDPDCQGFTTKTSAGVEKPICLQTSSSFVPADSATFFYRRRTPTSFSCTFTVSADVESLTARVTLGDWAKPNQFMSFAVNGTTKFNCGGRYGFLDQARALRANEAQVSKLATCYDGSMYLRKGDVVSVTLAPTVSSIGSSDYAAIMFMTFEAVQARSKKELYLPFVQQAGRRIWRQQVGASAQHPMRFNSLSTVGLSFKSMSDYNAKDSSSHRIELQLAASGPPFTAIDLKNPNEYPPLESATTINCAGAVGYSSIDGTTHGCDVYHLCTNRTTLNPNGSPFDYFAPASGTLTFRHNPKTSTSCTSPTTTSGYLLFEGQPVIIFTDRNTVRSFVGIAGTFAQVRGSNTSLIDGIASSRRTEKRFIRPLWKEIPYAYSYRPSRAQILETATFVLVDDISITEAKKTAGSPTTFCAIDTFLDRGTNVGCTMSVGKATNYISVKVAQTAFADPNFKAMISFGSQQVTCGGGNSFNGETSTLSGLCDLYLPCFQGRIPDGISEVSVMFTSTNQPEQCAPAAIAQMTQETVNYTPLTCGDTELTCYKDRKCIPRDQICDGNYQCSDGSDESKCSSWKLISRTHAPKCVANATMTLFNGLVSYDECKQYAIAFAASQLDSAQSVGMLYEENRLCVALTCLDYSEPILTTTPAEFSGAMYFGYLEDVSVYNGCTDDLSCNGKGTASSQKPCTCECKEGFLGDACESRRNMAALSELMLVTDPALGADGTLEVVQVVENLIKTMGFNTLAVSVKSYEPSKSLNTASTGRKLMNTANRTAAHYLIDIQSTVQNNEKQQVLTRLSSASGQETLRSDIQTAVGDSVKVKEVTGVSVLQLTNSLSCEMRTGRMSGYLACNSQTVDDDVLAMLNYTSNTSVILDYKVKFVGVTSEGKTFSGETEDDGTPIPCDTVSQETNSTETADCQTSTICYRSVNQPLKDFTFTPSLSPENVVHCSSSTSKRIEAIVTYRILAPPTSTSVQNGDAVTIEESRSDEANSALIGLFVCAGALFFCILLFIQAHRSDARMRRALFGILASLAIMAGLVLGGVYIDGLITTPSHIVFIDEYRSSLCSQSAQPMPNRITRIDADDSCRKLRVAGASEGSFYGKAKCSNDDGTYDGKVRVFIGRTIGECKSGKYTEQLAGECKKESDFFPTKNADELQHVSLDCFKADEAEARWTVINNELSPPETPVDTVTANPVPSSIRFYNDSNSPIQYFRGGTRTEHPVLKGGLKAFSLVSFPIEANGVDSYSSTTKDKVEYGKSEEAPIVSTQSGAEVTDMGTLFNGHNTSSPASDSFASVGSNRYMGIRESVYDLGHHDEFTITFWMRANSKTRGFAIVGTDGWYDRNDYSSPVVDRILEVLQNGQSEERLHEKDWHLYFGLYVNGQAETLSLVYANPRDEAGGINELVWDLNAKAVSAAGDVFSDKWHFISLGFSQESGRRFAQLFVDGRTSYTEAGWRVCFDRGSYFSSVSNPEESVTINDAVNENVLLDGALYLGYLNAGMYDVEVHNGFLQQEKVIGLGVKSMEEHAIILVDESRLLGQVMLGCFGLFLIVAIIFLCCGIRRNSKLADEDVDITKRGTKSAGTGGTGGSKAAGNSSTRQGASASRGASQVKYMVPAVLNTAQTMAIYFTGWRWPHRFEVNVSWAIFWLAFDINLAFPELPALASPAIQVFVAVCVVMILLSMIGNDHDYFVKRMSTQQSENELPTAEEHHPLTLKFRLKKQGLFVSDPAQQKALTDILASMWKSLKGLDPKTYPQPVPIKMHPKGSAPPEIINCTISMKRKKEKSNHIAVTLKGQRGDKAFEENLICELNEEIGNCPHHHKNLIKAVDSIHKQVMDDDGELKYKCAYQTTAGSLYRLMHKNEDYRMCPGIEGAHNEFYVCGESDSCGFAVCAECSELGIGQRISAAIGSKRYAYARLGMLATFGFVVLLLAQSVHMPIMKNALMIIYCHPNYQCDFPSCYDDPPTQFLIFVAFAILISLLMGVGLVFFMVVNVRRRKTFIASSLRDLFDEDGNMSHTAWMGMLLKDNSMLKNVYEPYTYTFMWVQPLQLLFKLMTVLPIVFAEPNSLTQLTLACGAEMIQLLFFIFTNPFSDHWVGFLIHIGSLHNVLQLGMMCFYRIAIFEDPNDDQIATYMILAACVYLVLLLIIIIFSVFAPAIREYLRKKKETQKNREAALNQMKDGAGDEEEQAPQSPMKDFVERYENDPHQFKSETNSTSDRSAPADQQQSSKPLPPTAVVGNAVSKVGGAIGGAIGSMFGGKKKKQDEQQATSHNNNDHRQSSFDHSSDGEDDTANGYSKTHV